MLQSSDINRLSMIHAFRSIRKVFAKTGFQNVQISEKLDYLFSLLHIDQIHAAVCIWKTMRPQTLHSPELAEASEKLLKLNNELNFMHLPISGNF
jgi:hypothetical protein